MDTYVDFTMNAISVIFRQLYRISFMEVMVNGISPHSTRRMVDFFYRVELGMWENQSFLEVIRFSKTKGDIDYFKKIIGLFSSGSPEKAEYACRMMREIRKAVEHSFHSFCGWEPDDSNRCMGCFTMSPIRGDSKWTPVCFDELEFNRDSVRFASDSMIGLSRNGGCYVFGIGRKDDDEGNSYPLVCSSPFSENSMRVISSDGSFLKMFGNVPIRLREGGKCMR